jgi:uncharacterized protein YqhQ
MSDMKPYIGGQAVIEGVMMRAPGCLAVAVRRPDGSIAVRESPFRSRLARSPLLKLPLVRGVATLIESLALGMSALRFSAEQQLEGLPSDESETESRSAAVPTAAGREGAQRKENGLGGGFWIAVSIGVALLLFKGTPQLLGWLAGRFFSVTDVQDWRFHALTGAFQLVVLLGYLLFVSRLPDMRRVFQYHGAEHKTIHAYEQGLPLTVENVRAQSTLHARCGTTFLVVVVFVSVVVGAVVTPLVLPGATGVLGQLQTFALRISLLPAVAAISFELQRLTARFCTTGPLRILLLPGFLFQRITTREPDDAQLEIAIAAMEAARWREKVGAAVPAGDAPLVFGGFGEFIAATRSSLRGELAVAPSPAAAE